jgi:integrase
MLLATAIYTGLRLSELLGLAWSDVDLEAGYLHVRKQLDLGKRVEPKTPRSVRDVVLMPQLVPLLREHREEQFARGLARPSDFVFASEAGTALSPRNVSRRAVEKAVEAAGLNVEGKPPVTMHAFRRTFASHLILDLGLDVVQVSRQVGHANPSITLNEYADLFERGRHGEEIRERMGASAFGNVLETAGGQRGLDPSRRRDAKVAQLRGSATGGD